MAKKLKEVQIAARITSDLKDEIDSYLESSETGLGELVRKSINEYLWAHPINEPKKGAK